MHTRPHYRIQWRNILVLIIIILSVILFFKGVKSCSVKKSTSTEVVTSYSSQIEEDRFTQLARLTFWAMFFITIIAIVKVISRRKSDN